MESFKEILHQEKLRYTKQRKDIWRELQSSDKHRDAEEIFNTLFNRGLKVSRATVYRTIDVLAKYSMIDKLDIGDGRARYEYNEKIVHHDHLVCTICGTIEEFHDATIESQQKKIAINKEFKLLQHRHQLFGICKECK